MCRMGIETRLALANNSRCRTIELRPRREFASMLLSNRLLRLLIQATTFATAAYASLGHAQPAANSSGSFDVRTERVEIRPGCSIMTKPGTKNNFSYIGGNCLNGLLEGIVVKVEDGDRYRGIYMYENGRSVYAVFMMRGSDGSWRFGTIEPIQNGNMFRRDPCPGETANDRATGNSFCRKGAAIFGESAFTTERMLRNQITASTGSSDGTNTRSASRDDPKVVGGAYRP